MLSKYDGTHAIGSLQDPVKQLHSGTFKGESGCTGTSSFVMKVPLCNLRLSVADLYQVPFKGPIDIYKVEEEILNVIILGKQENNPHLR